MKYAISFIKNYNKKDGYRQLNVRQLDSLRHWDHRGKCYMDRKRIQRLSNSNAWQHVPIYLQPFLRYGGISVASDKFSTVLVSEWAFFNHILLSPGYAPGTNAVNVTWIERIQCLLKHRSMCPSTFNRFPVIQAVKSKGSHFSTFFAHFGLPGYAPGTIAVNVTWIEREFNACQTPRSM